MKSSKCDMRGLLSFMILWFLSKKSMHGQELADEIEKKRGERPKAGTLYPALKYLKNRGLIKGQRRGNVIVYSLTKSGKNSIKEAIDYFCRSFGEIIKNYNKK
ncbi:MAG: PadR family transcriptional regulator [Candidatus Aenigmatarchaeota archaeon]